MVGATAATTRRSYRDRLPTATDAIGNKCFGATQDIMSDINNTKSLTMDSRFVEIWRELTELPLLETPVFESTAFEQTQDRQSYTNVLCELRDVFVDISSSCERATNGDEYAADKSVKTPALLSPSVSSKLPPLPSPESLFFSGRTSVLARSPIRSPPSFVARVLPPCPPVLQGSHVVAPMPRRSALTLFTKNLPPPQSFDSSRFRCQAFCKVQQRFPPTPSHHPGSASTWCGSASIPQTPVRPCQLPPATLFASSLPPPGGKPKYLSIVQRADADKDNNSISSGRCRENRSDNVCNRESDTHEVATPEYLVRGCGNRSVAATTGNRRRSVSRRGSRNRSSRRSSSLSSDVDGYNAATRYSRTKMSSAPSTTAASARGAGAPCDAALPGHTEPAVARGPTVTVTVAAAYTTSAAGESAATSAPTLTAVTHEDASIGVEDEPPGLKSVREVVDNIVSSLPTDGNLSNRYQLPLQPRTTPQSNVTPLSTPSLHPSNDLLEFTEAQPTTTSAPLAVGSVTTLQPPQTLLHATMTSVENLPVVSVAASNSPTCSRIIPSPGSQSTPLGGMSVLYDRRSPTPLSSCQRPTPSLPTYTLSASTPETANAVEHILHHLSRGPSPQQDTPYNAPAAQFSSAHDSEDEKRLEIDLRPQDSQTQRGKKRSRSSCKTASNAAKVSPSETVITSAAVNENDRPNHKTLALDESDNVEQHDIASCIDVYDDAVALQPLVEPAIATVKRRRVGGTARNVYPTRTLPRSARKTKPSPRTTISKRSRRSFPSSTAAATMSTSSLAASTAADVAEPINMFWKKEIRNRSKAQPEDGAPATTADVDTSADDAQTANTIPAAASEPGPATSPIPAAGACNKLIDRYVLHFKPMIDIEDIRKRLISRHYRFMCLPPAAQKCRVMIRILARDLEKLVRVATLFRRVMALLKIRLQFCSSSKVAQQEQQSRLNARIIELRNLLTINSGRLESRSLNSHERKLFADMQLNNIIVARSIIAPLKKYILEYLKEQFGVERKPVPQHEHWGDDYSRFYYVSQAISMITFKCKLYMTHCEEICLQLARTPQSAPGTGTSISRGSTQEGQDDQKSRYLPVENVSLPVNGWEVLPSKYWTRNKDGTYTFTSPKDPVATGKAGDLSPSSCMSSPSRFAPACIGTRAYRHALHRKPHCTGASSPLDDPVRDDHHNTDNNNGDEATAEKKSSHPDDLDCPANTENCTSEEEQPIAEIEESHTNAEEHHADDDVDKDRRNNDGEVEGVLGGSSFCGRRAGDSDDVAANMQFGPELERPTARDAVYLEQPPCNVYDVVRVKSKPFSCIKQLLSHQTEMLSILENTGAPPQMTSNTCLWRPATTLDSSTSWSEVSPSWAECKQNSQYTSLERFLLRESFFSLSLVEQKLVFDEVSDPSTLFHRIETFLISRHRVYGHAVNRCNENQAALSRSTAAAQPQLDFANLVIL